MRLSPIQMSFTNGEISPRLFGRSDLDKYWSSLETLENFLILPYGGVTRRDGLHFVVAQETEGRKARLIPFVFSTEQAYIIEAGHEIMRFYMNHGQILAGPDANTKLLLHMDGVDLSPTFIDSSAGEHTITTVGTAHIYDFRPLFGSGCGAFNGTTDYLTVADHADFDFSADDTFTMEVNLYHVALKFSAVIMQRTDDDNLFQLLVWGDGHVSFVVTNGGTSQVVATAAGVLTTSTWQHIRVVGDGTSYYIFVGGEKLAEDAITESMQNFTSVLYIGINSDLDVYFDGRMDELRISDSARSTDDFAPPTIPFPLLGEDVAAEIVTPYLESDLPGLKYFQSYDTMYLFHPDHAWRKLTRASHTSWTLAEIDVTNGPWLEEQTDRTFTPSAVSGDDIDVVASAAFFQSTHVGALLRLYISGAWGYVKITGVTDTENAVADVVVTLASTATSTKYQEGAWSDYRGHPSAGSFNEESMVAVANDNQPQTIWASKKGDFENFDAGSNDDDGFSYTIPASNRILWTGSLRELVLGAGDGIYKMTGGMDDFISPTNVRIRPGMAIGVKELAPIRVNNSLLYWQKGGRKLRELTYDPNSFDEEYAAPDLTLLADHITEGGVRYSAWQQEPNSALWTVRADGTLLSMTYMRPEEIVGWGRHVTDGEIESVASIPDPTDTFNEIWVTVKRETLDAADSDTVLFLHMDGEDGSTTFLDASPSRHTVSVFGGAQVDTAQSKFGGASGKFTSEFFTYLTVADHADFDFSADDTFTIEFFAMTDVLGTAVFADQNSGTDDLWRVYTTLGTNLKFAVVGGGVWQTIEATGALTVDTWHHIRVVGDGTSYYLFVDGELLEDELITQSMQNLTSVIYIGASAGPAGHFIGWMDEFKISKVARATSDFLVPVTNASTHRYVEYMDPDMMIDSGLVYSGGAVTSVSGLDHLEGKTVDIVGDGVVYTQGVVTSGEVDISPAASEIQIGLPYTSTIKTMKPIINAEAGTNAGKPKKWAELWVSVHETSGLTINDELIDFRAFSDVGLGEEIPLYTGNIQVSQLGWNDGRNTIEHDDPLPCTILGVFGTLEFGV